MNVKQILLASLIGLATSAAMADGGDIGTSNYPTASASNVSRSSVKADVLEARADGELRPAGEIGDVPFMAKVTTPSTVTRADIKFATLKAAKAGQLQPAGEEYFERPTGETTVHPARSSARNLFTSIESKFRSN
jgi:hypothetical protein